MLVLFPNTLMFPCVIANFPNLEDFLKCVPKCTAFIFMLV